MLTTTGLKNLLAKTDELRIVADVESLENSNGKINGIVLLYRDAEGMLFEPEDLSKTDMDELEPVIAVHG